jgi:phytoene synthase
MSGEYGGNAILPAFHDTVKAFGIPEIYFHELIDGAEMDLTVNRYQHFDDLYQYCYRVASVVGLVCIHIFGFRDEIAKQYAEHCGIAFQLTNILRDVKEDSERNRIYIPLDDLDAAGYAELELLQGTYDDRFRNLMKQQVERAKDYYERSSQLVDHVDPASRPGLMAMIGIYSNLLKKIEDRKYDVLSKRIALTSREKVAIATRSLLWSRQNGGGSGSSDQ